MCVVLGTDTTAPHVTASTPSAAAGTRVASPTTLTLSITADEPLDHASLVVRSTVTSDTVTVAGVLGVGHPEVRVCVATNHPEHGHAFPMLNSHACVPGF